MRTTRPRRSAWLQRWRGWDKKRETQGVNTPCTPTTGEVARAAGPRALLAAAGYLSPGSQWAQNGQAGRDLDIPRVWGIIPQDFSLFSFSYTARI
jgi:hypothetical protein